MIIVLLAYAIFSLTFTISKAAIQFTQPIFFVGIRMMLAGALLLSYQFIFNRKQFWVPKELWWSVVKIAFFQIYLMYSLEFWAMQYLLSSQVALFFALSPFSTAVFSYWFFKESFTLQKYLGLFIGFCGFVFTLLTNESSQELFGRISQTSLPEMLLFGAVIAYSYSWVLMRSIIMHGKYSYVTLNGFTMLLGGSLALITSFIVEPQPGVVPGDMWPFLGYLALLILVANVISFNLYAWLLTKYTATLVSFVGFIGPLYTAIFSWFWLGETVSVYFFVSILIIFSGLFLFYRQELKQGYIKG